MFQYNRRYDRRVKLALDTGHTGVKFGWEPFGLNESKDLHYVEAIRKALGENDFMIDVGLIWDAKTTIKRSKQYEPFNLFWMKTKHILITILVIMNCQIIAFNI